MATEVLLGPTLTDGPTTKVKDKATGKVYYKKRILPEGKFTYKKDGQDVKLDLSRDQLKTFVESFNDRAYDEVPFQFGRHDNDPNIRKGTLVKVEHNVGNGLDGYFELDEDAAKYVQKYPNFGVSPRLVLGIDRADGKKFAGAIQHVAGTVVPRMTGMGPWSQIELSEDETPDTDSSTPILDLSDEIITVDRIEKVVNVTTPNTESEENKVFTLSEDEYNFFKNMKTEYDAVFNAKNSGSADPAPAQVDLSDVTGKADRALTEIATMKAEALRDSWAAKKALLLSQGVPPAALDLADPVMTSTDTQTFDLSTDEGTVKITAREQMLGQLELMKGMIDLSGEKGHGVGGTDPDAIPESDMRAWMQANGL